MSKQVRIALAGNPNSGKTSIFNALVGSRQKVGNYPGVTVEHVEGTYVYDHTKVVVTDLPGTYSLHAKSPDEKIARDFLIHNAIDIIINVVDASNFERHSFLSAQLLEFGIPMIIVLNMSDIANRNGIKLDMAMISERLQCPVIPMIGHQAHGLDRLKQTIHRVQYDFPPKLHIPYGEHISPALTEIKEELQQIAPQLKSNYLHWLALRLLEGDSNVKFELLEKLPNTATKVITKASALQLCIESELSDNVHIIIAERIYGFASGLYREVLIDDGRDRKAWTDRIDDIVTHRIIGIPIFLAAMYLIFHITFTLGEYPMAWIESGLNIASQSISSSWPGDGPLKSMIIDGIIGGVGGVLVFLPNIIILFFFISLLEDTGYMARVAFIMDKLMHKIGLHGKSFIPMMIGFGCSVPAIMATRILENKRDRITTMMIIPLMSCGARFPIYALIIPVFFAKPWQAPILWSIYLIGILLAIITAKTLKSTVCRGKSECLVMELPPYHLPWWRNIIMNMWHRSWHYLKKAGTIILAISLIMWALTNYPQIPDAQVNINQDYNQQQLMYSVAGRAGKAIEPILSPLGFDWRIGTALFGALAAKEVFVAQLGIVNSIGNTESNIKSLQKKLAIQYSPLIGICILLFTLISSPCIATVAIMKRETGSWLWAIGQFFGLTFLAYTITYIVYQLGTTTGWIQ